MLEAILAGVSVKRTDVQVWDCDPLVILNSEGHVVFGQGTKLEFTPLDSNDAVVGHAIAIKPDAAGIRQEIAISTR